MSSRYTPSPYAKAVRALFDVQDTHASKLAFFDSLVTSFVRKPCIPAAQALIHWLFRTPGRNGKPPKCHAEACEALYAYIHDVEQRLGVS